MIKIPKMKHTILIIFLSSGIFLFDSCKKDTINQNADNSSSIVGNWELRIDQTGMTPTINYASGNGNILKFTATDYQVYNNGQLVKSGKYAIIKDTTALAGECLDINLSRIIYDHNRYDSKRIQLASNNRLTFLSGCSAFDSGSFKEYERQ
jgi:hypothetical protein